MFNELIDWPIESDRLHWQASHVLRDLHGGVQLLFRLTLTGTHFPERGAEPFMSVGGLLDVPLPPQVNLVRATMHLPEYTRLAPQKVEAHGGDRDEARYAVSGRIDADLRRGVLAGHLCVRHCRRGLP